MEFKQRLKDLREQKELTQVKLAKVLNMTSSTISKYERGDLEPNNDTIIKIADFFNVSVDYLLGRNGEIQTIAAHHNGDEWTEEELKEIEKFKEFVRMKKKQSK